MSVAAGTRPPTGAGTRRRPFGRRPSLLEAGQTAIIPLRPLSVGEILDGALLVVQRNARQMIGLPLAIAGGVAGWLLLGVLAWVVLGNTTARGVQLGVVIAMGVLGLFGLVFCLVWVTALLSRITLQTALGEGFAPAGALDWRSAAPILGPTLALALLQYVALQVLQTVSTVVVYAGAIVGLLLGDTALLIGYPIAAVVGFAFFALGYGYLSLTVPALANETRTAPDWIGKPARPTNPLTAFERSFRLVGIRGAGRVLGVFAGALLAVGVIGSMLSAALTLVVALFASSFGERTAETLDDPWVLGGTTAFSAVVALAAVVPFMAAVQTLLYLDLRIRREGLDLALRFDCVPVPQPAAPPPVPYPAAPSPAPPSPTASSPTGPAFPAGPPR